ncbi:MAG TPA: hypothetical protein VFM45_12395, partial [Anaeromyxobacteraceae bacterium]|nr:hypothetical protein [Anaeromyxobacteraceae bacterium]
MTSGTSTLRLLARLLGAYLLASLAGAVALFGGGGGHADIPLTTWPGWLLLAPAVPLLLAGRLAPPLQP